MSPNDYTPATETDYLFAEDMAPADALAEIERMTGGAA